MLRQVKTACLLSHTKEKSLDEVLFLLLRVHVVSLGVDDGCVGVRGVLRSFGLVR